MDSPDLDAAEAGHPRRRWLVAALVLAVPLFAILNTCSPNPTRDGWRLDLVQDFDTLPPGIWHRENGTSAANESSFLLARNVSTRSGVLRIQGKPESAGGRDYTSGRLDTNGRYALPDYFRAEVRAKVPYEQGMWAAPLWFRPTDGRLGEIDLVETYGAERRDPQVHQTVHGDYSKSEELVTVAKPFADLTRRTPTAWHTYTIEKTPGHIRMWVDGTQTADFSKASAPWFDHYFEAGLHWNLRVNLQIGGAYGLPDSSTRWDGDHTVMQLDYLKTWTRR